MVSWTWPSKFEQSINVQTAVCHGPQSCLLVRIGMSFVEGKVIFEKLFVYVETVEEGDGKIWFGKIWFLVGNKGLWCSLFKGERQFSIEGGRQ
jgi:hypothetical protein